MRYPLARTPPVQDARSRVGAQPTPATMKLISPIAPIGSRMEQRPAVLDQWGHMSLAGLAGDREVVPLPAEGSSSGGIPPAACALLGFLAYGFLSR